MVGLARTSRRPIQSAGETDSMKAHQPAGKGRQGGNSRRACPGRWGTQGDGVAPAPKRGLLFQRTALHLRTQRVRGDPARGSPWQRRRVPPRRAPVGRHAPLAAGGRYRPGPAVSRASPVPELERAVSRSIERVGAAGRGPGAWGTTPFTPAHCAFIPCRKCPAEPRTRWRANSQPHAPGLPRLLEPG